VAKFRYLVVTETNQNSIHDKIKRSLNSGTVCYHLIQNLLSSHLLFKNIKIKIYKTVCCFVWAQNIVAHDKRKNIDRGCLITGC